MYHSKLLMGEWVLEDVELVQQMKPMRALIEFNQVSFLFAVLDSDHFTPSCTFIRGVSVHVSINQVLSIYPQILIS